MARNILVRGAARVLRGFRDAMGFTRLGNRSREFVERRAAAVKKKTRGRSGG